MEERQPKWHKNAKNGSKRPVRSTRDTVQLRCYRKTESNPNEPPLLRRLGSKFVEVAAPRMLVTHCLAAAPLWKF